MLNIATSTVSSTPSGGGRVADHLASFPRAAAKAPKVRSITHPHVLAPMARSARVAERVYERRRADRQARGTWGARYVLATPSRARLTESLELYRVSLATAAELSGLGPATLSALLYPQHPRFSEWVHITTQSAVFGMRFDLDRVSSPSLITSVGTARRLEALAVLGWPWPALEQRLSLPRQTLMFRRARPRIRAGYAREVRDLYEQLSMRHGPSAHAAHRAAAKGWLPPLAWDDADLDDPRVTAPPSSLFRVRSGGRQGEAMAAR